MFGGCAAVTNEGDFVNIGSSVGAQLRNMNYAWMCPIVLEKALNRDPSLIGTFSPSGNSMIYVNKHGVRATNEKLAYNELAQAFFEWNPTLGEYSNLVLIAIWDQPQPGSSREQRIWPIHRSARNERRSRHQGRDDRGVDPEYLARLAKYAAHTGGLKLAPEFADNLVQRSSASMNSPKTGKDLDFHRGERTG